MSKHFQYVLPAVVITAVLFHFADGLTDDFIGSNDPLRPVGAVDVMGYLLVALLFTAILGSLTVIPALLLDRAATKRKSLALTLPLVLLLIPIAGIYASALFYSNPWNAFFRLLLLMNALFVGHWGILWLERGFLCACARLAGRDRPSVAKS